MKTFKEYINEMDSYDPHKYDRDYYNPSGKEFTAKKIEKPDMVKFALKSLNKNLKKTKKLKEDGMGGGAIAAGPTNVVGSGAIAGSGGKGGEPGVHLPRKKRSPVMGYFKRKSPQS